MSLTTAENLGPDLFDEGIGFDGSGNRGFQMDMLLIGGPSGV